MINFKEIKAAENIFSSHKEVLLPLRCTWTREGEKCITEDGGYITGADIDKTINCALEPMRSGAGTDQIPQGIEEISTHSILTLKAWGIRVNDTIKFGGNIYRITYKFVDQYQIDFQEYLAQIHNHTQ